MKCYPLWKLTYLLSQWKHVKSFTCLWYFKIKSRTWFTSRNAMIKTKLILNLANKSESRQDWKFWGMWKGDWGCHYICPIPRCPKKVVCLVWRHWCFENLSSHYEKVVISDWSVMVWFNWFTFHEVWVEAGWRTSFEFCWGQEIV